MPLMIRHRLFTFASLFSFLLCLAFGGGWVRSYFSHDFMDRYKEGGRCFAIDSTWGAIYFTKEWYFDPEARDATFFHSYGHPSAWEKRYGVQPRRWQGIHYFTLPPSSPNAGPIHVLVLSYWLLVLLTAILPARWLLLFYRRRQDRRKNRPGFPIQFKEQP